MSEGGPFHEGELYVQRATGEQEMGARNGRIIAGELAPNAAGFIARQELAVAASIDAGGQPWASLLVGPPQSFGAPDLSRVTLDRAAGRPDDPLWRNVHDDPRVGLIFIELESRKRYRVNGWVAAPGGDPLVVAVGETTGNCPKYITRRHLVVSDPAAPGGADPAGTTGTVLGDDERRIVTAADMAFVATANPAGLLDASHRGGRPGFVEVRAGGELWVPDYRGNSMFMTLGNLHTYPRAGLLFVDFTAGETLQLTGTTAIDLLTGDGEPTGGTHRAWTFTPIAWRRAPLARPVRAEFVEFSPFNP